MTKPNLLNPILVRISKIDKSGTVYTGTPGNRREPINVIKKQVSFNIPAQIVFVEQEFVKDAKPVKADPRQLSGDIILADGYIIVRKSDLKELSKTLESNDRIISYGNTGKEIACKYYLVGKKDAAHYSDQGQCTLEKWYFKDRN